LGWVGGVFGGAVNVNPGVEKISNFVALKKEKIPQIH